MKIKKLMQCLLSAAFLLMVFSPVAYGDLYWESIAVQGGALKGLPKGFPKGMPKTRGNRKNAANAPTIRLMMEPINL